MKFKVTTSATTYPAGRIKSNLEKLGFKFEPHDDHYNALYQQIYKSKKTMYHMLWDQDVEIEISTLEELMKFQKRFGQIIVKQEEIEIYDDYRE
jgi:Trm5-related predicted tRNA methylase